MLYSKETLDAIEADYRRLMAEGEEARQILIRNGRLVATLPTAEASAPASRENELAGDGGLRSLVIEGLRQSGAKWVRPVDLARSLHRHGVAMTGTTPLRARVSGELARLARGKKIERRSGKYRLIQEGNNG